jgi:hypothetical protein
MPVDQIIHIFRKDVRRHWREIALSLAILAAFAWNRPAHWMPLPRGVRQDDFPFVELLVGIGWSLLIVRVVHEEPLVGDRQFWVTRPYEWKKLLAAKALFIAISSTFRCSLFRWFSSREQASCQPGI